VFSGLLLAFALTQTAPALSAQRDIDLLQSYVGDWSGKGSLGTVDGEETVKCSLAVTSSSPTRVQFNGRCAIAGGTVSLKGTMGFIEERGRFEAVLNSNVNFLQNQVAVGRRSGSGLVFTMQPTNPDTDADLNVDVDLALKNGIISVNAKVTDTASGNSTTAKVPLEKKT
jgi:hypothetical protein